jgi:hypothetical protein
VRFQPAQEGEYSGGGDKHPATWDTITRRAYKKRYGKPPGA